MSRADRIRVLPDGMDVEVVPGHDLFRILANSGIDLNQACGGRGLCGKCKVRISAPVSPPSSLDRQHLTQKEIEEGIRLACGMEPRGGELVELPSIDRVAHKPAPPVHGHCVDPWPETNPGDAVLAVDLGTTNIACYLVDAETGRVVSSGSTANRQAIFGADVMTRLSHAASGGPEARDRLRMLAVQDIETICESLSEERRPVRHVVAVMNTAMETLLLGLDPNSLGRYPYDSGIHSAIHKQRFGTGLLSEAALHIPSIIGGFVGSDTIAAFIATDALETPLPPYLLIDIGTNAEAVLVTRKGIIACSSAAGPAFEGGNITCGMRAVRGAIEHAQLEDGDLRVSVIGRGRANGITGSGLFSLLGSMIRARAVDRFGMIEAGRFRSGLIQNGPNGKELSIAPRVTLSEADIQQFILAKASARAGVEILLSEAGLQIDEMSKVYLCGTFAHHIQPRDILSIGMIPRIEPAKIAGLANMAGAGAAMMAASQQTFHGACALAGAMRHVSLSSHPTFNGIFQEHVCFPVNR